MENPWHSKISENRVHAAEPVSAAVRVLLVGLPPAVRFALDQTGDIAVVGSVASAEDMFGDTARRVADVVVLDPHQAGVPAENVIEQVAAQAKVLVLSKADDDGVVRRAFRSGALGYLAADGDQDQVACGVSLVAAGGMVIGKSLAPRFAAALCSGNAPYPFPQLTAREQDVLERIAAGKSNHAIARELTLAPKTISNRVSAVFAKLGVAHRAQAIVVARDAGLGRS